MVHGSKSPLVLAAVTSSVALVAETFFLALSDAAGRFCSRGTLMEAILYNCCSAQHLRLPLILSILNADILLLTGMRWRKPAVQRAPYETLRIGRYTGYVWGYGDGALTN